MSQIATFGAGCFWGVEAHFRELPGVLDAAVGYTGGATQRPSYRDVCSGTTGHAEVVQVEFDESVLSYEDLLELFFRVHNPTTLNRQGADIGTQYRSVIFVHDAEQERIAREVITRLDGEDRWPQPIVTTIEPATTFWKAEEYHQRYLEKNGLGLCRI